MTTAQTSTVLFLAANPVRVQLLQLGEECRAIEDKIRGARFRDQLRFHSRWAARPDDLLQALNEDSPSILHFSGHGAGDQGLCFQADDGSALSVSADGLARVMRAAGASVTVVILNACYSEMQAQALVTHVPCVIGMSDSIGDEAAIAYSASFYRALAFGKSVANAHEQGLAALALPSPSERWRDIVLSKAAQCANIPKLLTRADTDADCVYIVQTRNEKTTCTIIIKATLKEFNSDVLFRVTEELRRLTGDLTLQIVNVDEGSVRLTIVLSPKAARILAEMKTGGQLAQLCGFCVTAVLASPEAGMEARDELNIAARSEGRLGLDPELCAPISAPGTPSGEPTVSEALMIAPMLAKLIERTTGLALDRGGVSTALDRFVAGRMRVLGLTTVESYVALAADPMGPEQQRLIDAITVPHTWFYRDPEQLRTIARLMVAAPAGPIAVWVAGCATGEEAYTLAMIGRSAGRDLHVLATDINETALTVARRGVYSALAVRDIPDYERRRWLVPTEGGFAVNPALQSAVIFMRHNLVEPAPTAPRGTWDLVVCRNVLIYFAPGAASRLLERFARAVREGGALVVGAGEVVFEPPVGLELVSSGNRLVLRRPARSTPAGPPAARDMPAHSLITPEPGAKPEPPRLTRNDDMVSALTRGHGLFERGEIAAAVEIYDQLSRAHPDVAEVWLFLGIAHYHRGAVEEAAKALRASLRLDSTLWPAGFFLARAYERLGQRDDASQQYDLLAADEIQPVALQSTSAVINELRALRHDFRNAAGPFGVSPRPAWPGFRARTRS